jgi:hypothetical protein
MQTFDQALLGHVLGGKIDADLAFEVASNPHDFKLLLDSKGKRSSGIEQVMQTPEEQPAEDVPEPSTAASMFG